MFCNVVTLAHPRHVDPEDHAIVVIPNVHTRQVDLAYVVVDPGDSEWIAVHWLDAQAVADQWPAFTLDDLPAAPDCWARAEQDHNDDWRLSLPVDGHSASREQDHYDPASSRDFG